eukprot:CAMPEP_0176383858 /NCGR_PEP_ID=MMETSP0126-20121128/33848_1 /TAXON_ID=141414 ORGANISM="Strombidinopsis acuminatum, Strain SPMC142" /NCGR_SAMPLE_ID=MMETSP0126 /ASSEMBLY_ACC=CAM_ASM_000229 /LENGTH=105 /DNA_ID=CAMNT_0017749195 /DNA_START=1357 /DNA_END=1674 /DNA_ORIENTATION=-
MNNRIYYGSTIALYAFEVLGAVAIADIGVIFEFVTAIAISAIAFTLPGVFYVQAENKFAPETYKQENKIKRYGAYGFIIAGFLVFLFCTTKTIWDMVSPTGDSVE